MKKKIIGFVGGVAMVVATLVGCADSPHQSAEYGNVNHAPADVVQFPDGFRNVAHKCDGTNMVYSVSSANSDTLSGGVAVVPNDPRCKV
jgi:uncharacterized secreted protein with C-terminal beta-propeller domain